MGLFWTSHDDKAPLVLVAEDDPGMRAVLVEFLQTDGYRTLTASNGEEAYSLAESKAPKLILLDMIMPLRGGLETLKLLKQNPKTKGIPVIMVTGEQKGKDIETCFGWGAVAYVIKPLRHELLRAKVKSALGEPGK